MAKRSLATEYQLRRSFTAFPPKPGKVIRRQDRTDRINFALAMILALVCSVGPMVAAYLVK